MKVYVLIVSNDNDIDTCVYECLVDAEADMRELGGYIVEKTVVENREKR